MRAESSRYVLLQLCDEYIEDHGGGERKHRLLGSAGGGRLDNAPARVGDDDDDYYGQEVVNE